MPGNHLPDDLLNDERIAVGEILVHNIADGVEDGRKPFVLLFEVRHARIAALNDPQSHTGLLC